jgi:PAS domain S-box-containing protein
MTFIQPVIAPQTRYFPSRIALLAAAELVLIALLLRLSNTPAFFAAAVACSLCSLQLGVLLINRFQVDTRRIRKVARQAEFSTQAVLITDGRGQIKWTNPQFTRLTGFYLSEISGKTFSMVLHGQETRAQVVELIRQKMRLEQPFDVELMQYNRAGETMWTSSKGEPIRDTRGNLTHYVITQTDISDQRRLIEELANPSTTDTGISLSVEPKIATSDKVAELTRQLESLGSSDDRDQLQTMVDGLKREVETCVSTLPAVANAKTSTSPATNQHEREG